MSAGGGTCAPAPTDPHQAAYLYLLELCRGEAQLHVDRALKATATLEARKRGLTDSIVVFAHGAGAPSRGEAEVWLRQIGQTEHTKEKTQ